MPSITAVVKLRDRNLFSLSPGLYRDHAMRNLLFRVSPKRVCSFYFYAELMLKGERITVHKMIGNVPGIKLAEARREAIIALGRIAAGRIEPGKRKAIKFGRALDDYVKHLKRKAESRGKPPRWAYNVEQYAKLHIRPKWGNVSLIEMSKDPKSVRDWHGKLTDDVGAVTANRCAQIVRSCYRFEARANRSLPPQLPTSAVVMNGEDPRQVSIKDFHAWAKAWREIPSPLRRSFVLCSLLTGARRADLAGLKWSDVHARERYLIIGKSKTGIDIRVPLSWPIARCLRMARGADDVKVFPGCAHNPVRDKLPNNEVGNKLRHTWRTICANLKVDDLLSHALLGHAPRGVSAGYVDRIALAMWPAMREAQRRISADLVRRLGIGVFD